MRKLLRAIFIVLALILSSSGFPWGGEGHQVVGLIAEKYMTTAALANAGNLLDGSAIDAEAGWADEYRQDHRETAPSVRVFAQASPCRRGVARGLLPIRCE